MTKVRSKDCCVGEPCYGDPRGLHSLDCPVYNAWVDRWIERTYGQPTPPKRSPGLVEMVYAAGYRAGLKDARDGGL